ncbi:hypothetical protein, partial [Senegalimassilia anaerobia]
ETIGGFYGTQWLGYCGVLLLIALSMALVGLFVRPHLTNLNRLVAKEIEQSDLLNVEEALVPERRYRIGQLIRALSDHDEFHNAVRQQADTFLRHYPRLKRGALILGIAVPVAVSVVFAVTTTEKVVILTAWLIWLVILIGFLLGLEMVRDNIQRQASIDSMSDDELRGHLADRGKKVVKELVPAAMSTARVSVPADRSALAAGVSVPLPPVGVAADDLADQPASACGVEDAGWCAARKPKDAPGKAASLMDLAAKGRPAYFDGPFLIDEEAHGEKGEDDKGDEELLEAEVPALELNAEDLEALAQRKAERGKHGKKQKKHKKKGDSEKGGGHA